MSKEYLPQCRYLYLILILIYFPLPLVNGEHSNKLEPPILNQNVTLYWCTCIQDTSIDWDLDVVKSERGEWAHEH